MKTATRILSAVLIAAGTVLSAQNLAPVEGNTAAPAEAKAAEMAPAAKPETAAPAEAKAAETVPAAKPETAEVPSSDPTVIQTEQKVAAREQKEAENEAGAARKEPNYKASRLIPYVIITANYKIPALLVETARKQLNVPYIVLVDDVRQPNPDARAVFFPPRAQKPVYLPAKDLSKLLAYLRARDVIILGNSDYVPSFVALAVTRPSRTIMITDADWKVNAIKLSNILNSDKIINAYRNYMNRLEADRKAKRAAFEKAEKEKEEAIRNADTRQREMMETEGF